MFAPVMELVNGFHGTAWAIISHIGCEKESSNCTVEKHIQKEASPNAYGAFHESKRISLG